MSWQIPRREMIQRGALSLLGFGLSNSPAMAALSSGGKASSAILLFLVGGPSQIDTWDPKPDAPPGIRSPYRAIRTNVAGIQISELFPRMARQADKYALIRSCYHKAPPVHDTGHQLLQTGRVFHNDLEFPHIGYVLGARKGARNGLPANVLLPGPISRTGGNLSHGQTPGFLATPVPPAETAALRQASDITAEPGSVRERYGDSAFGRNCLRARRLVESGVRFVTVNMFQTVFGETTWDTHGWEPFSTMSSLREHVGPMFDRAYTTLLQDLDDRGLLASTLVVATGEFGRTPRLNVVGGRDHWPQCWTMMMAGGGVRGGQAIGASDAIGALPKDRPVSAEEVVASMYHALGIPLDLELPAARGNASGRMLRLLKPSARPVRELFV